MVWVVTFGRALGCPPVNEVMLILPPVQFGNPPDTTCPCLRCEQGYFSRTIGQLASLKTTQETSPSRSLGCAYGRFLKGSNILRICCKYSRLGRIEPGLQVSVECPYATFSNGVTRLIFFRSVFWRLQAHKLPADSSKTPAKC